MLPADGLTVGTEALGFGVGEVVGEDLSVGADLGDAGALVAV